ncbi:50S ribosomal protein L7/L12 [Candidatus Aerophobetes bacterium]|uniref:Large ribosomal subunit protein bL12 n=1 Tax=Aerophobetes bacterium TaxID=2030807 RepID=A0A2A4X6N2_UNCAE|nr:MAG: 50S ribosomal protein L7/L12 [Candidatus Aerophobetes bacterium]
MAQQNIEEIVESLSSLTVLELSSLKKALEEKWDVTAAAAPVMMAAAGGADQAAAEEPTEFNVSLDEVPPAKKISIIKAVREITGLGLKEAKDLVDSAPKVVKENAAKSDAEEIVKKLSDAGAKASSKGV